MYNPAHFREDRKEVLHELMARHSLATLVTSGRAGLVANHLPMILDPAAGPLGTLRGHLARVNPDWQAFDTQTEVLAIFQGPSAYITPSWYPSKQETGKVVPTYNYAVVHARGRVNMFDDPARLAAHVRALTDHHEAGFERPWSVNDAPPAYIQATLKGIIGIEIAISHIEGKWKVSQNRAAGDRTGASQGLRELGESESLEMADLIAARLAERPA